MANINININGLTKTKLILLAMDLNIKGYSKYNKANLILFIINHPRYKQQQINNIKNNIKPNNNNKIPIIPDGVMLIIFNYKTGLEQVIYDTKKQYIHCLKYTYRRSIIKPISKFAKMGLNSLLMSNNNTNNTNLEQNLNFVLNTLSDEKIDSLFCGRHTYYRLFRQYKDANQNMDLIYNSNNYDGQIILLKWYFTQYINRRSNVLINKLINCINILIQTDEIVDALLDSNTIWHNIYNLGIDYVY